MVSHFSTTQSEQFGHSGRPAVSTTSHVGIQLNGNRWTCGEAGRHCHVNSVAAMNKSCH